MPLARLASPLWALPLAIVSCLWLIATLGEQPLPGLGWVQILARLTAPWIPGVGPRPVGLGWVLALLPAILVRKPAFTAARADLLACLPMLVGLWWMLGVIAAAPPGGAALISEGVLRADPTAELSRRAAAFGLPTLISALPTAADWRARGSGSPPSPPRGRWVWGWTLLGIGLAIAATLRPVG